MKKVLIVEDDTEVCNELKKLFDKNGYNAEYIKDFSNVCDEILNYNADLVLLDINLPSIDGKTLLKDIRRKSDVPIIMVTSNNTEMEELLSMSFGADDFVTKPYNPAILLLRVEAMFKRMEKSDSNGNIIKYEDMIVDVSRGIIENASSSAELSKNELKILTFLLNNKGSIVSRDKLMDYLWDMDEFVDDNTLTVNINRLRKKMEQIGLKNVIKTKRGQGYIIG